MPDPLRGKSALVTGASRGIGRATAIGLAAQGARVVVGYHKNEQLAAEAVDTISSAGGSATAVGADLSHPHEVVRLFDEAEQHVGSLDIVVANAASIIEKPLAECTEQDFDRIFDTNTRSVFFTLQQAARRLNDGGRIIVTSTGGTQMFFPNQSLYLGSKAAAEQFVRALAAELGGRNITVNAVSPGPTDTDMMQDQYRDSIAMMSPFHASANPTTSPTSSCSSPAPPHAGSPDRTSAPAAESSEPGRACRREQPLTEACPRASSRMPAHELWSPQRWGVLAEPPGDRLSLPTVDIERLAELKGPRPRRERRRSS